jgi:hypothetical protein
MSISSLACQARTEASTRHSEVQISESLPLVIAVHLNEAQEQKLLDVLKEHKEAIGWSIGDIKGISPAVVMHKIHLEENGYSGYNQVPVDPEDQEKTTFTCPFGTFAYGHMPFGLCNAPTSFLLCM